MKIDQARRYACAAVLGLVLAAGSSQWASARDLTVVGWGGALSAAEAKAFDQPFATANGVQVREQTYNGGLAQVKAQAETGNVSWDVVDAEMTDAARGCDDGLLEQIPASALAPGANGESPQKDFFPDALQDCGVANYVWATVYAYSEKTFANGGPQTIADFFNVDRFPGKRGLRKSPKTNLEWALMADGVPRDKVYAVLATPQGVDRAFAVLDRVKKVTVWWEAGAQPPQLLADGEVVMTSAYNGRLFNAIVKEKQPFKIVWDGQVWDYGAFIIPKGSKNRELAMAYIRFATSPQRLADLTNYISYGPSRASARALVAEKMRAQLPTSKENFAKGLRASADFWAEYGDQLTERFNTWLLKN